MRFSTAFAIALSAVAVSANVTNGTTTTAEHTVTQVVTQYTTYCPLPTEVVEGNKTYTVTEPTTLTISNCPCTRTMTYTTVTSSVCPGGCSPSGTGALPTVSAPPVYTNGTVKATSKPTTSAHSNVTTSVPVATASATPSSPVFEGSANRATVAAGALAGLIGVAAYLL
ncbi:uncharacterized protein LAJ45_02486 [Morchella importuna]|uniref:Clock-controlled protein 6 n=1 Tax=Morchella conica CCBAS932 TaxID=1392247 RepID=A0A3N4KZC4_9PEZI|nr:uncharacterized protein LAJ45_02486 [Morchella importuna]KAH8153673.1 hypothetical protein LAJ45_02486 [Morchella importuna]RPB14828.1 hypothetical protein P167DRAFT_572110 [Morchella conica CCBAS932]